MARPGIMIYFDILEPVRMLPDADKGRLLMAMLEYGRDGVVPDLDGPLGIVWSFVHPMIDKDGQRYDDMKLQREYAAFCKKRKQIWLPKIAFDDWVCMTEDERQRAVDPVDSRCPSTATSSTINHQPSAIIHHPSSNNHHLSAAAVSHQLSTENENGGGDGIEKQVKVLGGELGKNVVFLSDEQFADLLDKMDLETFNHYVDKLSNFIIKNDAHVKNHYETILRWWREDGAIRG